MTSGSQSWSSRLATESGLAAILHSSRDTKVLCLQRFVRMFAYGFTYIILVHFLSSLDIPDARIGLFMTLTLLGDTVISFFLTTTTDQVGRRRVLAGGALMMTISGVVFSASSNYWFLVLASVLGVVSPSGNEIGPFRAVEESILAQLTPKDVRSDIFAWYTMFGTFGAALGTVSCGWLVQLLQGIDSWTTRGAYRAVFMTYAAIGLVKLVLVLTLSKAVELETTETEYHEVALETDVDGLLSDDDEDQERHSSERPSKPALKPATMTFTDRLRSFFPYISPLSRSILYRLLLLFSIDSFASGMASPSWLTYFFTTVHSMEPGALGTLFLVANFLATLGNLAALPLARRLGPLKTMVFTHLPSALFLAMIPFPPATGAGTWIAMAFLALRSCTSSMDQAPRQAFLAAAVLPAERTAVLGVVNVIKSLAQAGGLGSAGALTGSNLWVVVIGGAGVLKGVYDLLMLWMFLSLGDRETATPQDEERR